MKRLPTKEYIGVLRELIEQGDLVSLTISGSSMAPFLCHERDTVYLKAPAGPLKKGDIVFYQRENGQYVLHRIIRTGNEGLYICGDGQTEIEGPVDRARVFAVATAVRRNGKMLNPGDFWWFFFERVWTNVVKLRPWFIRLYRLGKTKGAA